MPSITASVLVVAALSLGATTSRAQTPAVPGLDPAVIAYTMSIKHLDLNIPLDRWLVAGYMDQLASAAEGFAIGRGIKDEGLFQRIRQERHALRRFVDTPLAADGREAKGHALFKAAAQLLSELDRKLGSDANAKAAIEAFDRSARSLDSEDPLRWQPDNIEQFLRLGGEALTQMNNASRAHPRR